MMRMLLIRKVEAFQRIQRSKKIEDNKQLRIKIDDMFYLNGPNAPGL